MFANAISKKTFLFILGIVLVHFNFLACLSAEQINRVNAADITGRWAVYPGSSSAIVITFEPNGTYQVESFSGDYLSVTGQYRIKEQYVILDPLNSKPDNKSIREYSLDFYNTYLKKSKWMLHDTRTEDKFTASNRPLQSPPNDMRKFYSKELRNSDSYVIAEDSHLKLGESTIIDGMKVSYLGEVKLRAINKVMVYSSPSSKQSIEFKNPNDDFSEPQKYLDDGNTVVARFKTSYKGNTWYLCNLLPDATQAVYGWINAKYLTK